MTKEYLAESKNGFKVFYNPISSHASTHFSDHPGLKRFVIKVLKKSKLDGDTMRFDADVGAVVGDTDLVETNEGDEIIYALRPKRDRYSRFVKNKKPQPTSFITLALDKVDDEYKLYTAFVGKLTPSFPGGDFLPEQSEEFWSKHALVWGRQEVLPETVTKECPW